MVFPNGSQNPQQRTEVPLLEHKRPEDACKESCTSAPPDSKPAKVVLHPT
jgi:hypothetical protein